MDLIHKLIKNAKPLLIVNAVIILAALFFAFNLQIEPSVDKLIPDEGEFNTNKRILETSFHENNAVVLYFELDRNSIAKNLPDTLDSDAVLEHVEILRKLFGESQYVSRVGEYEISENGYYGKLTVSIFIPNGVNTFKPVLIELQELLREGGTPPGVTITLSGFPTLLDRVGFLLINDNLKTVILTAVLIFLVLYWYFRNLRLALIGVASPLASLIVLAGIMSVLEIPVTITLAAVGVLVVGLGADYGIHVMIHYEDALKKGKKVEQAIRSTLQELSLPILASYITTLAGFAALMLGVSPSSQDQGIVLSIGITIIFLVTILLTPALLVVFDKGVHGKKNKIFDKVQNAILRLAKWQAHHPKTVLSILGILTVVMFFGLTKVEFSTSNSNWIPNDDPISTSFRQLAYVFGDDDSLTFIIQANKGDLRNVQTVKDLQRLEAKLMGIPSIEEISSPFTNMPLEKSSIHEIAKNDPRFNKDYTIAIFSMSSLAFTDNNVDDDYVLNEVRELIKTSPIYFADISLFGDSVRFNELENSLQRDTGVTTMISLLLVFIVASLLYVSIRVGFTALLPIIVGVIWAIGLMGYFGVPFTSLSTGIVALVLGIGVDFSIHLVNNISNGLKEKLSLDKALSEAVRTTGGAIILSSVTTFLGFMALSFAALLGTRRLGWSLALSIIAVFIVTIIMVPALMALRRKK